MNSDIQTLQNIRLQTLQQIEDILQQPKPSYSIDGQSVQWEAYLKRLQSTVDWCDQKLSRFQPVEFITQVEL